MIFSVSGKIDLSSLFMVIFLMLSLVSVAINDPLETLSPTLTFTLEIFPSKGEGT